MNLKKCDAKTDRRKDKVREKNTNAKFRESIGETVIKNSSNL